MTRQATAQLLINTNRRKRIVTVVRWMSILLILASLLLFVRSLPTGQAMEAMKGWISGLGIWGPVVFVFLYVVATVLFVPGTILTLAAGALFGLVVGTITVSIGSTLGAALAFLIARYVARDKIAAMAGRNRNFDAVDKAIGEGGWKIVAMLRLSPAIPFNLQNYLYGLTPVRFWTCVVTSWVAMLPGTFLYVYLGHVTGATVGADRARTPAEWGILAIGLLATAAVTVYIAWLARRKLQEQRVLNQAPAVAHSPAMPDQPSKSGMPEQHPSDTINPTAASSSSESLYDWQATVKQAGGSEAMARILSHIYLEESKTLIDQMRAAFVAGHAAKLSRAAHTLKGAALCLHATAVVESAQALENQKHDIDPAIIEPLLTQLIHDADRLAARITIDLI